MTTKTVYPNSTDCGAWRGWANTTDGRTGWDDTPYSSGELDSVSTDDSNYVRQGQGGDFDEQSGHHIYLDSGVDNSYISEWSVQVKADDPDDNTKYLYAWDYVGSDWEQVDSDAVAGKVTLSATLSDSKYWSGGVCELLVLSDHYFLNIDLYYAEGTATYTVPLEGSGSAELTPSQGADLSAAAQSTALLAPGQEAAGTLLGSWIAEIRPGDPGCDAWRGLSETLGRTDFDDTHYTAAERADISVIPGHVTQAKGSSVEYAGHHILLDSGYPNEEISRVQINAHSIITDYSIYTTALYAWDYMASEWVRLTDRWNTDADSDFTETLDEPRFFSSGGCELLIRSLEADAGGLQLYYVGGSFRGAMLGEVSCGASLSATATGELAANEGEVVCSAVLSAEAVGKIVRSGTVACRGRINAADVSAQITYGGIVSCDGVLSASGHMVAEPWGIVDCSAKISTSLVELLYVQGSVSCDAVFSAAYVTPVYGEVSCEAVLSSDAFGLIVYSLYLDPEDECSVRVLEWDTDSEAYLYIDGRLVTTTVSQEYLVPGTVDPRLSVALYNREHPSPITPLDIARLDWQECDRAASYTSYKKEAGGAFQELLDHAAGETGVDDGPLMDGTYRYKVAAFDEDEDSNESAIRSVTVDSTPEPPTDLDYSFDDGTQTLTVSWTASASSDVAGYRVYSSAGEPRLDLGSSAVDDLAGSPYTQVFTNETGTYIFIVHAYDSDGNEEFNLQPICIVFEDGYVAATMPDPFVRLDSIAGPHVLVKVTYDPTKESGSGTPGIADRINIYWDGGSGEINWTAAVGTINIGGPTERNTWEWTSPVLATGTYRFGARVATASGRETQNSDYRTITVDASVPEKPVLTVELV